jgi:membrane protein implicated in regulation of membrane protease activity
MIMTGIVFLLVGALVVAVEIHSQTIYLLVVALACFAAGGLILSVHTDVDTTLIVFGLVLLAGMPAAQYARRHFENPESDKISCDDVGALVEVADVREGTIRVRYRGTEWDAVPAEGISVQDIAPGMKLCIVNRDGNTLIVTSSAMPPH